MDNYGLIIRHLRKLSKLNVRQAAEKIQRSTGWLSEIENSCGTARLTEREFNRIVEVLDGNRHKPMFKTWISTQKRSEQSERAFDGAVLKYIRIKKELGLKEASRLSGLSTPQLSKFETGHKLVTVQSHVSGPVSSHLSGPPEVEGLNSLFFVVNFG
jgi:transcriptional regulator with XRE-family HTH domain